MADQRNRTRGSARPGAPGRGRRDPGRVDRSVQRRQVQRERLAAAALAKAEERQQSRLTGRAAVLVLVLAVLAVSFASSLRAYLHQRSNIEALEATIAERKAAIEDLQDEKDRWSDPAYVAMRAKELGYVDPGEIPYIVLDQNGEPLGAAADLDEPVARDDQPAWYENLWTSTEIAGDPPTKVPPPPSKHLRDDE